MTMGHIHSWESMGLVDGPGIRTVIFLQGCRLRCQYCHNPDTWEIDGRAETKTPEEIIAVLNRFKPYYGSTGGVTFSGGECFMQHDFMRQVAQWCKEQRIHTAVETSAYVSTDVFLDVMQFIDFAFIDLKCMDPEVHRRTTGVDNQLIMDNIRALVESGWQGRLILRMPVIAGVNDSDENIAAMADFMDSLGLFEVNILPFHRLGDSKYNQMGRAYEYSEEKPTPPEKLEHIQGLFLDRGIACYVAEEVLY